MSEPSTSGRLSPAEKLFAHWLERVDAGREPALEELCRAHPGEASELRRLGVFFEGLRTVLQRAGFAAGAKPLAQKLEETYGAVDPGIELATDEEARQPPSSLLKRLSEQAVKTRRYQLQSEIGRGGMGAVLKVWDEALRRTLAMKVILDKPAAASSADAALVQQRLLGRFLEEAQITGQLEHPGIVPVYELGLDPEGRAYFTMRFVRGRDLGQVFALVAAGQEGWNETRALGVILKVCDAMAFAHRKRVIHRDLKPGNVMVGSFGEVYVMDWGLARVLGRHDSHDLRWKPPETSTQASLQTDRRLERQEAPDSPLFTMDGDVVGTPAYMPPEQARGETDKLSPRSDVYSIGAMLYHLLARQLPYVPPGARMSSRTVLVHVLNGPPTPLQKLRPDLPAELIAICEKAMARASSERYADTLELAEDLRAYLEHRVVKAYQSGAVAELRKWVERNRGLAAAIAAAFLLLVLGLTGSLILKAQSDVNAELALQRGDEAHRQAEIARGNEELARSEKVRADIAAAAAERRADEVLRLSAFQDLEDLIAQADSEAMWPLHPDKIPAYQAWLARGERLVAGLAPGPDSIGHYAQLEELRRTVHAQPAPAAVVPESAPQATREAWWLTQLEKLVAELEAFRDQETGLMGTGVSPRWGWGVGRRLAFAQQMEERTVSGEQARALWQETRDRLANSPQYAGLELQPQLGLVSLGPDPRSGLLEFADLVTGDPPRRDAAGQLLTTEETGLVFVLIPGGSFYMGAQSTDPEGRNYSPTIEKDEGPVHEVRLLPFFLSKYELTQGQWLRFTGANPAFYNPKIRLGDHQHDLRHPVEGVNWFACQRQLARLGLELPTEAQWEYAARAGTNTPWSFGDRAQDSARYSNVADAYSKTHGGPGGLTYEEWDDGYTATSPVGAYLPNPLGLHDVHGNVWEWCRDSFGSYELPVAEGTGERQAQAATRPSRGGPFAFTALQTRSSNRYEVDPSKGDYTQGVRPARRIEP